MGALRPTATYFCSAALGDGVLQSRPCAIAKLVQRCTVGPEAIGCKHCLEPRGAYSRRFGGPGSSLASKAEATWRA